VSAILTDTTEWAAAYIAFGLILMGLFGMLILILLFLSLAIHYTIWRLKRYFVEEILLPGNKEGHNDPIQGLPGPR
jgi:hypothetical protein